MSFRHRWVKRRLGQLLEPGEDINLAEGLPASGSWAMTDRALYIIEYSGSVKRYPLDQISSVHVDQGSRITTIRTTRGEVIIVVTKRGSAIFRDLRQLVTPAADG